MELPAGSVEYVHVPISTLRSGVLEDLEVEIAFTPSGVRPGAGDWSPAEFSAGRARRLTEPDMAPGVFDVWVRITDTPEVVLRRAGRLALT